MAEGTRSRPGKKAAGEKKQKAPSKYHLYSEGSNGSLAVVGEFEGRNAEQAVGQFVNASNGDHAELREKVKSGQATLVVVPDRNLTRVSATVETKTTVKLTAV